MGSHGTGLERAGPVTDGWRKEMDESGTHLGSFARAGGGPMEQGQIGGAGSESFRKELP